MTRTLSQSWGQAGRSLAGWLLFLTWAMPGFGANEPRVAAPLSAEQVVERMVEMNQRREQALQRYSGTRLYHLEYHGFPSDKSAEVEVKVTYRWPDQKVFVKVSENGSETLRDRVLKRLLETEQEAMRKEIKAQSLIHPDNYGFRLAAYQRTPTRDFYVLEVTPRRKHKFLFRGKIWVDGQDFAVVRIEGEPAKNPSWWTTHNEFQRSYAKVGDFWLPARNESVSQIRLLGEARLTIEYRDYELAEVTSLVPPSPEPAGGKMLNDRAAVARSLVDGR